MEERTLRISGERKTEGEGGEGGERKMERWSEEARK